MNANNQNKFRIVIDYDASTGEFQVAGPITNRMTCYGMLEFAKDKIKDTCDAAEKAKATRIETVTTLPRLSPNGG